MRSRPTRTAPRRLERSLRVARFSLSVGGVEHRVDWKPFEEVPQTMVALPDIVRRGDGGEVRLVDRILLVVRPRGEPVPGSKQGKSRSAHERLS